MNINSWFARGVVCMAAISFALGASACNAQEPRGGDTTVLQGKPKDEPIHFKLDPWVYLASDLPADMSAVQGNTFGLSDWRMPQHGGLAQGFFGVAQFGTKCVVTLGLSGATSDLDAYTVSVETRTDNAVIDPETASSIDEMQRVIDSHSASCK